MKALLKAGLELVYLLDDFVTLEVEDDLLAHLRWCSAWCSCRAAWRFLLLQFLLVGLVSCAQSVLIACWWAYEP